MNEEDRRLAEAYAKKVGVPVDLLATVVDEPLPKEEAKRIENEYGLDATLSRENAIEAAALRLRDTISSSGGDEAAALRALAGGDGRVARRLTNRRTAVGQQMAPASRRTASGAAPEPAPASVPMAAAPTAVAATPMPAGAPPAGEPEGLPLVPPGALKAYAEGRMSPDDAIEMELAVERGEYAVPAGFQLRRTEKTLTDTARQIPVVGGAIGAVADVLPSMPTAEQVANLPAAISEAVTGAGRRTATTEAASDITMSPSFQKLVSVMPDPPRVGAGLGEQLVSGLKTAAMGTPIGPFVAGARSMGIMAASDDEKLQMLAANDPRIKIERDEKGNPSFVDPNDGQRYSFQPGLRLTDAPRAVANVGAFLPAGRAATIGGAMLAEGATQLGLEAAQASAGGSVDPTEVALATATGGLVPAVQAARQGLRGARAVEAVADAVPAPAAVAAAPMPDEAVGGRILAASRGDAKAQAELIEAARVSPEAVDAQQVLGVELPMDVLADSPQIKDVAALVRSQLGGAEKAAFEGKIVETAKAIDDGLAAMDSGNLAQINDVVLKNLDAASAQSKAKARRIYDELKPILNPEEIDGNEATAVLVDMPAVKEVLKKKLARVGGDVGSLSPGEKRLLDLSSRKVTYGQIDDEKRKIQEALRSVFASQGDYGSSEKFSLGALEAALRNDQLAAAEAIGGPDVRRKLKTAHLLVAQQKAVEKRAQEAFGVQRNGEISPLIKRALVDGAKDSVKAFRQMLKLVPKENQKEAIASAISAVTRTADGSFDFAKYRAMYEGWRRNPEVYAGMVQALGPDADKFLQSAFVLSKRITDARGRKVPTGQSLQQLGMARPQRLVDKVMESVLGRVAVSVAGAAASGPAGAVAGPVVADMIAKSRPDMVKAASDLLRMEEFQRLAIESAGKEPSAGTIRRVTTSKTWRDFARAAKLPRDPTAGEQWLRAAMAGARQEASE